MVWQVLFYRKAQLLVDDLHSRFADDFDHAVLGSFPDSSQLTADASAHHG